MAMAREPGVSGKDTHRGGRYRSAPGWVRTGAVLFFATLATVTAILSPQLGGAISVGAVVLAVCAEGFKR